MAVKRRHRDTFLKAIHLPRRYRLTRSSASRYLSLSTSPEPSKTFSSRLLIITMPISKRKEQKLDSFYFLLSADIYLCCYNTVLVRRSNVMILAATILMVREARRCVAHLARRCRR